MKSDAVLCNDGERHRPSIRVRLVKCRRGDLCRICRDQGGHGPYAYANYRGAAGPRSDYIGRIKKTERGERMPPIEKISCPSPGCGTELKVKLDKKSRPTVFCRKCGFQGMVKWSQGVELWGYEKPKGAPGAVPDPAALDPGKAKAPRADRAPEPTKKEKDEFFNF